MDKILDEMRKCEHKTKKPKRQGEEKAQRAGILTSQERRMAIKSSDGEHVVTIGGSLGRHGACGWCSSICRELEPMHGHFGSIEGGIEVQRTIKRADMRAL